MSNISNPCRWASWVVRQLLCCKQVISNYNVSPFLLHCLQKVTPHALSPLFVPLVWPKPVFLFPVPGVRKLKLRLLLLLLVNVAGCDNLAVFVHAKFARKGEACRTLGNTSCARQLCICPHLPALRGGWQQHGPACAHEPT